MEKEYFDIKVKKGFLEILLLSYPLFILTIFKIKNYLYNSGEIIKSPEVNVFMLIFITFIMIMIISVKLIDISGKIKEIKGLVNRKVNVITKISSFIINLVLLILYFYLMNKMLISDFGLIIPMIIILYLIVPLIGLMFYLNLYKF